MKSAIEQVQLSAQDQAARIDWSLVQVLLWQWIRDNKDKEVKIRFYFIKKKWKIRQFCDVFCLLLGDPPFPI